MNLKVKIFNYVLPEFTKGFVTHFYINYRKIREYFGRILSSPGEGSFSERPRIVYMTGFPRSGTTVLKWYFGGYNGFEIMKFNPEGFFVAWKKSKKSSKILIDKSNHYIYSLENIFRAYGDHVAVCCIVRDPRDNLLSLLNFGESREVPRDMRFWRMWYRQYLNFISYAENGSFGHRIYLIRYEDLVKYPCEAKRDFLNWVGLSTLGDEIDDSYSIKFPNETPTHEAQMHRKVKAYGIERWKNPELGPERTELVDGWKRMTKVRDLMFKLGYFEQTVSEPQLNMKNFRMFQPLLTPENEL